MSEKVPELSDEFPSFMEFYLRDLRRFSRLNCFENDSLVRWHVLDVDIFRACEIDLKVDVFEVLDVEGKNVGELLLCNDHFLFDLDPWVQLLDLLF
jgi:hypothetical protein